MSMILSPVYTYVCTTYVDPTRGHNMLTFEGVSGSKRNLVGVFYV